MNTFEEQSHRVIGKYIIERELGCGGFATVFLGREVKTNELHALKVIDRQLATSNDIIVYVEHELRIMARLNHPNIAKVHDIIYTEEYIMIVMEFMEISDLNTLLNNQYCFKNADKIRIACELLDAINYIHERGICHRDIKPANIMFDRDLHPKIIDFGFCREKGQNLSTYCGTELFMAPEIICGKSYDGQKADIWAFGVTIHALATNQVPFDYANEALLINDIKNNQLRIDIKAQGLLGWICKNSLQINPDERLTAAQMLDYAKGQLEFETLQPCLHHCAIRRANTNTTMPKIRFQINTPVIIRARIGNINYKKRRQIRSLE